MRGLHPFRRPPGQKATEEEEEKEQEKEDEDEDVSPIFA